MTTRTAQIMFRMYPSSHAILRALAGLSNMNMSECLDVILREEAKRRGLVLKEPEDTSYSMSTGMVKQG
jgi:hypothetical protein